MTKRVLVTGGSGFIGRQAVPLLRARGFDVITAGRGPSEPGHFSVDLLDPAATHTLLERIRPTDLLHLAWDVTPGVFWESRANLDWIAASLRLYRSFAAHEGQRATIAGTCAEYAWSQPALEEDSPLRPATLYGLAKQSLHALLEASAAKDGVSLAWGRVFLLYGPHEAPARLVSSVTRHLLRGEPAPVGDGRVRRDFMHVHDVAAALVSLLDQGHHGAVNIASGQTYSIEDVVSAIGAEAGRPDLIQLNARPSPPGEPLELRASGERLTALGFRPRYTLATGIADTVSWWRTASISGE